MTGKPDEIIKGIIYSELIDSKLNPRSWLPSSLSQPQILELINSTVSNLSNDYKDWAEKISILPIPVQKFVGITYFYENPINPPKISKIAAVTLLINENFSEFLYRHLERLKRDLEALAGNLKAKEDNETDILTKFYSNIIEFVNRFHYARDLTVVEDKIEEKRKVCVILSYFNNKLGSYPFNCYPQDVLSEEQQRLISDELDSHFKKGVFTISYPEFKAIHLYFEIPSDWARGNVEMCLISLIFEKMPSNEMVEIISLQLWELKDKLYEIPNIYKGFYLESFERKEDLTEIKKMNDLIKKWIIEVYKSCIEQNYNQSSELKLARILRYLNNVKIIEKLSEGPIKLRDLQFWAYSCFGKAVDLMATLSPLIDSNYALLKRLSGNEYVILLKGIRVFRVAPLATLNKLKTLRTIYPEIYPKLLKSYENLINRFFQKYKTSNHDTVTLSRIISDPLNHLIISKFREGGVYLTSDFKELFSGDMRILVFKNLKSLKKYEIITEIKAHNEIFMLLKTDLKFIITVPKYILLSKGNKDPLPEPLNEAFNQISKAPSQIKEIFKRWFSES